MLRIYNDTYKHNLKKRRNIIKWEKFIHFESEISSNLKLVLQEEVYLLDDEIFRRNFFADLLKL